MISNDASTTAVIQPVKAFAAMLALALPHCLDAGVTLSRQSGRRDFPTLAAWMRAVGALLAGRVC
jgi:hypothetical protein